MFILKPVRRHLLVPLSIISGNDSVGRALKMYNGSAVTVGAAMLSHAVTASSASSISEAMFIFGGTASSSVSYNDISRYAGFVVSTDAATLSPSVNDTSASTLNLKVYVFGGNTTGSTYTTTSNTSAIQGYDGTTRSTESATLVDLIHQTCASAISTNIFIFGGDLTGVGGGGSPTSAIQRYDGTTRTTDAATLASTNTYLRGATLSSVAFLFGGSSGGGSNAIQRYDGTTRTTDAATLSANSYGHPVSSNGTFVSIFGVNGSLNAIQRYDGTTRTTDAATLGGTTTASNAVGFSQYSMSV